MGNLPEIENILPDVSGEQYITKLESKMDELVQKLLDGDGGLSPEGHGSGTGEPAWASTNALKESVLGLVSIDPGSFDDAIQRYSTAAGRIGASQLFDKAFEIPGTESTADDKVSYFVEKARKTVAGDGTPGDPGWTGDSAESFEENFAKYYIGDGEAAVDQRLLLNSLQLAMEAHRAVYARVRADAYDLVNKANEATGLADDSSPGGSASFLLTALAAVAAIGAAAVSGGVAVGWALAAASASGGASIIGAVPKNEPQDYGLEVCCIWDLFFSIQNAVSELAKDRAESEKEVKTAVEGLVDKIGETATRKEIIGPFVADADGNSPIDHSGNGNGKIDDGYLGEFDPPA